MIGVVFEEYERFCGVSFNNRDTGFAVGYGFPNRPVRTSSRSRCWKLVSALRFRWIFGGRGKECHDGISFSGLGGNAKVLQDMNLVLSLSLWNNGENDGWNLKVVRDRSCWRFKRYTSLLSLLLWTSLSIGPSSLAKDPTSYLRRTMVANQRFIRNYKVPQFSNSLIRQV